MNILEAYLKKYKQIIILILGLPCTNKSEIAKEFGIDLGLEVIKINDYLKLQGRYNHLNEEEIEKIQRFVDARWAFLSDLESKVKVFDVVQ